MANFQEFVSELEKLCVKHGVVIQAVGGVKIYEDPLRMVKYDRDETSGDLIPMEVTFEDE